MSKEEIPLQAFQHQVSNLLLRHRSFLDVTSKLQEANARVNRALMKAVTECGCIEVKAKQQAYMPDQSIEEWKKQLDSHLDHQLCDHCADVVKNEIGNSLFYLTALCNLLQISLPDVIKKESENLSTLGMFHLR